MSRIPRLVDEQDLRVALEALLLVVVVGVLVLVVAAMLGLAVAVFKLTGGY